MSLATFVISVYNEEEVLTDFYTTLIPILENKNVNYELIFVNDGSVDDSFNIIEAFCKTNSKVKGIHFSRNFGHEAAMIAGIDKAKGDCVICMDCDLQHPPEKIPDMLDKHEEGYDIITMIATHRKDASLWKRITTKLFYIFLNRISPYKFDLNASDFFLFSKPVIKILKKNYREQSRFLRGYIQTLGFEKTSLKYISPKRKAGRSNYSLFKLIFLSFNAVASFSKLPLRLGIIIGLFFGIISFIVGIYSIIMYFLKNPVSGYTTIVVLNSFMFSILFILIGIIGEYTGFLFDELKSRPLYIIKKESNFDETQS